MFLPPLPAADTPSVLVESAAHVTWRTVDMPAALEDLDKIGQLADGEPATAIGSDLAAARRTERVQKARTSTDASATAKALADAALAGQQGMTPLLPDEPTFYVAGYIGVLPVDKYGRSYGKRGDAEKSMVAALAEVAAVLDL